MSIAAAVPSSECVELAVKRRLIELPRPDVRRPEHGAEFVTVAFEQERGSLRAHGLRVRDHDVRHESGGLLCSASAAFPVGRIRAFLSRPLGRPSIL